MLTSRVSDVHTVGVAPGGGGVHPVGVAASGVHQGALQGGDADCAESSDAQSACSVCATGGRGDLAEIVA